jgi:hypothetical protein
MRFALLGFAAALALGSVAQAQAPAAPAAPAAAAAYSSASKVGDLIDNPAVKAALLKIIPEVINHPQLPDARDMALRDLAQYAPELTPAVFAQIDAELAKIPKS